MSVDLIMTALWSSAGHYIFALWFVFLLVHGQVTIIFVVSVCLFVLSFSQPSLIRF